MAIRLPTLQPSTAPLRAAGLLALAVALAGMAVMALTSNPIDAQQRRVPLSRAEAHASFAPVVKSAAPAVVNVYVKSRTRGAASPFADDPFFRRFFGRELGMPEDRVESSLGSGVVVDPDGVIITNTHVIKSMGAAEIRVAFADRREYDARVLMQDEKTDIAILKIEGVGGPFPAISFADSDRVEVGDLVLAIGNPFGVGQTVTSGIVSALARSEIGRSDAQVFIQTDAAINPGNSGGALVDMEGRLVGINTAIYSRTGGSHGIGFAIPSNLVRLYVDSALAGRQVERVWLGARLEPVTREIAESLGLERVAGALAVRVYDNAPAARAGLRAGDIIVRVDQTDVADPRSALYRLTTRGIGKRSELGILRAGRPMTVQVAIESAPPPGRDDVRNLSGAHPLDGARVANLLPSIADDLGVETSEGVVVLSVRQGSTAAGLGFQPGDLVVAVGRKRIASLADLEPELRSRRALWQLAVQRGNRVLQVQVPG